jgi:hypothetical protein
MRWVIRPLGGRAGWFIIDSNRIAFLEYSLSKRFPRAALRLHRVIHVKVLRTKKT